MDKIVKFFKGNILAIVSFVITLISIYVFYSSLTGRQFTYILNADILYFPSLFIDLFKDGNSYSSWMIPGAPGFFPDNTLYFILMFITGSIPLSAFLFGLIQFMTIVYLFTYIVKLVLEEKSKYIVLIINSSFLLFVIVGIFGYGYSFTFQVLSNTYHNGPFVITLLSLVFLVKYLKNNKIKDLLLVVLFGVVSILSDKLYIIMFTIPITITLLLFIRKCNIKKIGLVVFAMIFKVFIAILIFNIIQLIDIVNIRTYSAKGLSVNNMIESWNLLSSQFGGYISDNFYTSIIIIIPILVLIYLIVSSIYNYFFKNGYKSFNIKLVFTIYATFFMIIVFFTPVILGDYNCVSKLRYNIYVLYLGVLFIGFVFFQLFKNRKRSMVPIIGVGSSVLILIIMLVQIKEKNLIEKSENYFNYYPSQAQVIDIASKQINLKKGVATYWNSKPAWLFNTNKIKIYPCLDSGYANTWIVSSDDWFFAEPKDSNDVFNFVLFKNSEDTYRLFEYFGEPKDEINIDDYNIYIYPDFTYSKKTKGPIFLNKLN